ncbi:MAG: YbbR-like domain-containing protein [Candidatus Korobacteraceae bacterium]|jgi:YbbR domain-containing protein
MLKPLRQFLGKYVVNNLPFKLISLAIAIMLWWAVGRDSAIEIPMTVPLEFLHAPGNLEITSDYPFQAQVTLRGPEHLLQEIRPSQVHALLDLEGAEPGERTFDLSASQVKAPHNVKVLQVVPAQFQINFDRSASRTVEVQPRVIGTLLSGYEMKEPVATPSKVTIVGPERRVSTIVNVLTDPVDATGVVGNARFATHAYVADPLVRVQTPGPIYVTVKTEKSSKTR